MKNNTSNQKTENFIEKKLDWSVIQSKMQSKFGQAIFESWIKKIQFINEFNNYILISVSTRFIRDWITSRYLDQILKIIKSYNKNVNRIEFVIKEQEDNKINNTLFIRYTPPCSLVVSYLSHHSSASAFTSLSVILILLWGSLSISILLTG